MPGNSAPALAALAKALSKPGQIAQASLKQGDQQEHNFVRHHCIATTHDNYPTEGMVFFHNYAPWLHPHLTFLVYVSKTQAGGLIDLARLFGVPCVTHFEPFHKRCVFRVWVP